MGEANFLRVGVAGVYTARYAVGMDSNLTIPTIVQPIAGWTMRAVLTHPL